MRNIYNILYSEHPFLQYETLSEIWPEKKKKPNPMDEDFQKLHCPSYFMVKRASVYLLPQYKPWWALWQSGLGVSLAGCGAALHPASCHPQDSGICRRSPGNTLTFISLENRSSAIKKTILWVKKKIIHATYFVVALTRSPNCIALNITILNIFSLQYGNIIPRYLQRVPPCLLTI